MTIRLRLAASLAIAGSALGVAQPALADGDVVCSSGPRENWKSVNDLKKAAWLERWEIIETRIEGDCYEVYARNQQGQVLEAFFHPVTLEKLVVFRRGSEIYRKRGFTG